jgi:hypothetical protein
VNIYNDAVDARGVQWPPPAPQLPALPPGPPPPLLPPSGPAGG